MVRRLSRSELRSWVTLVTGITSLINALDRHLRDEYGISHDDYRILAGLSRADGNPKRMSDLARVVGYSPSRLSHAIARFESEGWVARAGAARDGRVVEVVLTESGSKWVGEVSDGHLAHVRALLFETLGAHEARQLADLMRRVGQAALRRQSPPRDLTEDGAGGKATQGRGGVGVQT